MNNKNTQQLSQLYREFNNYKTPLAKNIFLHQVYQQSPTLALKLIRTHVEEMLPIIYTPTVAEAVTNFRHELRHPQALYLSYKDRGNLEKILQQHKTKPVKVIVVTDGERILGIGDQGASGVEISSAKLKLYSLFANINPKNTLPMILDVGTNNQEALKHPNYFGWQHNRITGKNYDAFIAEFVKAVKKTWPNVLLQWEDFGKNNAGRILRKYRKQICSFNDDIQGTAVVTLAAILSGLKITQQKLSEQRIVIFGAGSSGIGIANLIAAAMHEDEKIPLAKARQKLWLLNSRGLINTNSANIHIDQKPFLRSLKEIASWTKDKNGNINLLTIVKQVKPTILIGCSGQGGTFTKEIIEEITKHVARPIILPLSNPTAMSEATPQDLINWTHGRALVATGSPFPPAKYGKRRIPIAQCNNAFSFPGIGLGIIKNGVKEVTNEMFYRASKVIYENSPAKKSGKEMLLPSIKEAAAIARKIANKLVNSVSATSKRN